MIFVILAYLLLAITVAVLPKLVHENCNSRWKSLKLILTRAILKNQDHLTSVHLKLMFLFFNFFIFLILNFLAGSITTDKITVRTEDIVDSPPKLISTSKTVVFGDGEEELVKTAPEGSFLNRLSKKKFLVLDSAKSFVRIQKELNNYVLFTSSLFVVYLTNLFSKHAKKIGSVAFIESIDFYERLCVFQIRKDLEKESKRFINSR